MGTITEKGELIGSGLRSWFEVGDVPTQAQFDDFITSMIVEGGADDAPDFPFSGALEVSTTARALSTDSWAFGAGAVADENITAQFGAGTNAEPNSLQIGSGIRILSQAPTTPKNGDLYIDATKIYGYTGGAKVELSNGLPDSLTAYGAYGAYLQPNAAITQAGVVGGLAVGNNATVASHQGLAVGLTCTAVGPRNFSHGSTCTTAGTNVMGLGFSFKANGTNTFSGGYVSSVFADNTFFGGRTTTVAGSNILCLTGVTSKLSGDHGLVVIGSNNTTLGDNGVICIGGRGTSSGSNGVICLGTIQKATGGGPAELVVGQSSTVVGPMATAIGGYSQCRSTDGFQFIVGSSNTAVGKFSWVGGNNSTAVGANACFATGSRVTATGSNGCFARGKGATAQGNGGCMAMGTASDARGNAGCFTIGMEATAIGHAGSFAIGTAATSEAESAGVMFSGFNDEPNSILVGGTAPMRANGSGIPGTPIDGDMWVAGGFTYIRSNGVSVQIT